MQAAYVGGMPPADIGASGAIVRSGASALSSPAATENASAPASASASASAADDTRLVPGGPGYRRMSFALFAAGVATFALLYSTQALLPAISGDLGVTADQASWTVSAATGGLALAVIPLSALSERFGRRATMTAALCVAAVVALLVPLAPGLGWLVALRAVQGAALAGVPASAMAYLAEEVRAKALVGAIGLFVAGNAIGGMTGRILAGWVAQAWGWRAGLAAVGALAVLCAVAFRVLIPKARHFTPSAISARSLGRTVGGHLADPLLRRLYAIGALFMTVFGAVYTVIGYRLADAPFSLPQGIVGSIFLIYLVGTVSSAGAGRLVGRMGRRGALYLACRPRCRRCWPAWSSSPRASSPATRSPPPPSAARPRPAAPRPRPSTRPPTTSAARSAAPWAPSPTAPRTGTARWCWACWPWSARRRSRCTERMRRGSRCWWRGRGAATDAPSYQLTRERVTDSHPMTPFSHRRRDGLTGLPFSGVLGHRQQPGDGPDEGIGVRWTENYARRRPR